MSEVRPQNHLERFESDGTPWRILVVDDDEPVHILTEKICSNLTCFGKPLEITRAMSAKEAIDILDDDSTFSLIMTGMVMETDGAGLRLAEWIGGDPRFESVYLILRTGSPGLVPYRQVVRDYRFDACYEKAELTTSTLKAAIVSGLQEVARTEDLRRRLRILEDRAIETGLNRESLKSVEATLPSSWKILIVDDEPSVHDITYLLFKNYQRNGVSIEFLSAYSGQEAREILNANPDICMVITDNIMETDDAGYRLVDWLHSDLRFDNCYTILSVGLVGYPHDYLITRYGFGAILEKPTRTAERFDAAVTKGIDTHWKWNRLSQKLGALEEMLGSRNSSSKA